MAMRSIGSSRQTAPRAGARTESDALRPLAWYAASFNFAVGLLLVASPRAALSFEPAGTETALVLGALHLAGALVLLVSLLGRPIGPRRAFAAAAVPSLAAALLATASSERTVFAVLEYGSQGLTLLVLAVAAVPSWHRERAVAVAAAVTLVAAAVGHALHPGLPSATYVDGELGQLLVLLAIAGSASVWAHRRARTAANALGICAIALLAFISATAELHSLLVRSVMLGSALALLLRPGASLQRAGLLLAAAGATIAVWDLLAIGDVLRIATPRTMAPSVAAALSSLGVAIALEHARGMTAHGRTALLLAALLAVALALAGVVGAEPLLSEPLPVVVAAAVATLALAAYGARSSRALFVESAAVASLGIIGFALLAPLMRLLEIPPSVDVLGSSVLRANGGLALAALASAVLIPLIPRVFSGRVRGRVFAPTAASAVLAGCALLVLGTVQQYIEDLGPGAASQALAGAALNVVGALLLAGLMLAVIASVAVTRTVTRPVERLSDAMRDFAQAYRGMRLITANPDEIRAAQDAFDELAAGLVSSDDRFRRAFHGNPAGLVLSELASGRILEANGAFSTMIGVPPARVIGRTTLELGLWHSAEDRAAVVRALEQGRPQRNVRMTAPLNGRRELVASFEVLEFGGVKCVLTAFLDITAQERLRVSLEQRLREEEALARFGAESLRTGDLDSLLPGAARAFAEVLGASSAAVLQHTGGRAVLRAVHPAGAGGDYGDAVLAYLGETRFGAGGVAHLHGSGHVSHVHDYGNDHSTVAPAGMRSGISAVITTASGTWGSIHAFAAEPDSFQAESAEFAYTFAHLISSGIRRREDEQERERLALYDRLTGLPNRALFRDRLEYALRAARRHSGGIGVLLVGLDRFSDINDAHGHATGDEVLFRVGEALAAAVRTADTVARVGGDEFAVLLGSPVEPTELGAIAEKVMAVLQADAFEVAGRAVHVASSIGMAIAASDERADELLRRANTALQVVKRSGGAMARMAEPAESEALPRLTIARDLGNAIRQDQLFLEFQPVIDVRSGACVRAEALVRWRHPELGLVPPSDFIRIAEETGSIRPLTQWVLADALRQWRAWANVGVRIEVAVNISSHSLQSRDLADRVRAALETWHAPDSALHLEITETALMQDIESSRAVIEQLRERGVRFGIDDFGTGYSALGQLQRVPVDELKIDRSFVSGMLVDPGSLAIVRSTIALAHDLGLRAVAEGVESQAVLAALAELGCDMAQGYFFGRPMSRDDFRQWYRRYPIARLVVSTGGAA